ncbi:hypothetical protein [Streptomonospora alba]|uniref:hypothetical protein n=1 Tax=Streptomonospora alba TaxID=183763 RepID=UPI000699F2CA|nr:hypothetical protein [Streptomonospora alba]
MDNPLKRKNEAAADTAGGGSPEPAGSGTGEQEPHRTADKPTTEPVDGSAGAAGAVGSGGADARHRPADRAAGSPAETSPDGRASTGPKQGSAASETAEGEGSGASRTAAPAVSSAPTTSEGSEAPGPSGASGATTAVPAQSARGPADGRPAAGGAEADEQGAALFTPEDAEHLQQRWRDVQSDFVDDPRSAVDSADRLVDEMLRTLNERLAARKQTLEKQWSGRSDSGTEDLRTTMRGYRAFFRQLLDGSRG